MNSLCPRILFCSLSAKYALYKEVERNALKFSSNVSVIGCDSNPNCEAASSVDDFIVLPNLKSINNTKILEVCKKNRITHILPTRDAELAFWAAKKVFLQKHGIQAWVSELPFIKSCDDKLTFFEYWEDSVITPIQTFQVINPNLYERWVIKKRVGSGSQKLWLNLSKDEAISVSSNLNNEFVFQPFIEGREFTAEAWVSNRDTCHGPILRWREKVVDGESHRTTLFQNIEWEELIRKLFLHIPGARGHCLAQVIVDKDDHLHLVEINPRLGGASPLALRAGLNSITWHLLEESGSSKCIPSHPQFPTGMSLTKINGVVTFNF